MLKERTIIIFLAIVFVIIALVYLLPIGGAYNTAIKNILFLFPPFIASVAGYKAYAAYGRNNSHGISLLFITIGLFCLFIGETLFALFDLVLHIDPFPSIADIFYLAAYPLLITGILREINSYQINIQPLRSLVVSCISIAVGILVFNLSILPSYDSSMSFLGNVIGVSYGISDVVLMVAITYILLLTMDFKGGKIYSAWFALMVATVFMLLGDIVFAIYPAFYAANLSPYKDIDLLWTLSYLLFAYGLFRMFFIIRDVEGKIKSWLLIAPQESKKE